MYYDADPSSNGYTVLATVQSGASIASTDIRLNRADGVNTAPAAADGSLSTNQDTAVTGSFATSISDPEGDSVAYSINTQPSNGSLSHNSSTGSFTYTPTTDFSGTDTFAYQANDGALSDSGTITVTVLPVTALSINDVTTDTEVASNATFTVTLSSPLSQDF